MKSPAGHHIHIKQTLCCHGHVSTSAVSGQENVSSFPLAGIFFQNMMSDADQGKLCTMLYVCSLYTVAKKVQDIDIHAEVTASGILQKLHINIHGFYLN